MSLKTRKRILCLDFDGVIHSYESGWQGVTTISDPPVEGVFEFLEEAVKNFEVHIYSSRSKWPDGITAMSRWLYMHFNEWRRKEAEVRETFHEDFLANVTFPDTKPPAFISIDDRAITFTGTWPSMEFLLNFQPWTKGEDNPNTLEYKQASQGMNASDGL